MTSEYTSQQDQIVDRPILCVTDFGHDSAHIRMKGALDAERYKLGRDYARILGEIHTIRLGNVLNGSFELAECASEFVHRKPVCVGVVDPGVGTERQAIALCTSDRIFYTGPNNGLSHHLLEQHPLEVAVLLDESVRRLSKQKTATFDGRDLFAVAAARLSAGVPLAELGRRISSKDVVRLTIPEGTVEHVDTVSSIAKIRDIQLTDRMKLNEALLRLRGVSNFSGQFHVHREKRARPDERTSTFNHRIRNAYSFDGNTGDVVLLPGSSGSPEIAVLNDYAGKVLNLEPGDRIELDEVTHQALASKFQNRSG